MNHYDAYVGDRSLEGSEDQQKPEGLLILKGYYGETDPKTIMVIYASMEEPLPDSRARREVESYLKPLAPDAAIVWQKGVLQPRPTQARC